VEMPPFHRRPEDGAQHVMDVIDRFGCVRGLCQMRHVRLDRLGRDVREGKVAKSWEQVLFHDVLMILLRRVLVLRRQHVDLPLLRQRPKRHAGSRRAVAVAGLGHFPPEDLTSFRAGNVAERFVTQPLSDRAVRSNLELPPANRPPCTCQKSISSSLSGW
jgi:hypothetical protein